LDHTNDTPQVEGLKRLRTAGAPRGWADAITALAESGRAHGRDRGDEIVTKKPPPANPNLEEEVENEENANGFSTNQMLFHGGVVQKTPRIYLVFGGSSWTSR
jgi:hypothetical protein